MNCSGRGTPVTVAAPATSTSPASELTLCACEWAWDAGADLFDLRPLPALYPALQSDCVVPTPGILVIWSLLLLLTLLRYRQLGRALWRRLRDRPKTGPASRRWRTQVLSQRPVKLMLVDVLLATPACVVATCLKLADPHGAVLGSDVAFTVLLMVAVGLFAGLWAAFQHMQFRTLTVSHNMRSANIFSWSSKTSSVLRLHFLLELALFSSYVFLTIVPTFVALGLNPLAGPVDNGEYVILIVRNLGVVTWQLIALVGYALMLRQVRSIKWKPTEDASRGAAPATPGSDQEASSANGAAPAGSQPGSPSMGKHLSSSVLSASGNRMSRSPLPKPAGRGGSATQNVLAFLQKNVHSNAVKQTVALLTYTLFSIPPAWPYQSFNVAFGIIILHLTMSPAKVMNAASSAAAATGAAANANAQAAATPPSPHGTRPASKTPSSLAGGVGAIENGNGSA